MRQVQVTFTEKGSRLLDSLCHRLSWGRARVLIYALRHFRDIVVHMSPDAVARIDGNMAPDCEVPKPTHIYREERTCAADNASNALRQSFDNDQFENWRYLRPAKDSKVRFFVGTITWEEVEGYYAADKTKEKDDERNNPSQPGIAD